MPEDLIQYLSEEDLIDIVDYLHSLKSPPLTPATSALGGQGWPPAIACKGPGCETGGGKRAVVPGESFVAGCDPVYAALLRAEGGEWWKT
jgi:hypothetical protein